MTAEDQRIEKMRQAVEALIEHFDSVQIMASITEDGSTNAHYVGRGDFYARLGMAHEFIENDKSQITARDLSAAIKPREDE